MKIYNVIQKIDGLVNNDFDYEAVYNSGYTAGYGSGYTDAYEECHHDYSKDPLTFEILSAGTITWELGDYVINYSKNGGEWTMMDSSTTIDVVENDEVRFVGNNSSYNAKRPVVSTPFNVKGNIMSLIDSENYETLTELTETRTFRFMFAQQDVIEAENLILPATTLTRYCYSGLFGNCTRLVSAPELPATSLADFCYFGMFNYCASLENAPVLPATTLAISCYRDMFMGCTSLNIAPELPATELTEYCYGYMLAGCTSLTTAPELPATTLAKNCYYWMFHNSYNINYVKCLATDITAQDCTKKWLEMETQAIGEGTFVKNPAMNEWTVGVNGIPEGWTVVDAE